MALWIFVDGFFFRFLVIAATKAVMIVRRLVTWKKDKTNNL